MLLVNACLLASAMALVGTVPASATETPARYGALGYFWDDALWDQVATSGGAVGDVVMSADSGPGTAWDPSWADRRDRVELAGQRALGFVAYATGGLPRPAPAVTADAASWASWYGTDGIYLDGTPTSCAGAPALSSVVAAIRAASPGARIVANSYAAPEPCIADLVDVVVTFTGTAAAFSTWSPPAWATAQPASRFWIQVHSVDPGAVASVTSAARSRNAATLTITTTGTSGYPWHTLPSPADWATILGATTGTPFNPVSIGPPMVSIQQIASVNYFEDEPAWTRSRSLGTSSLFVIVNPDSGPGAAVSARITAEVAAARAIGQTPLGYIHTLWGTRPADAVLADARLYRTRYAITGVFLDEGADSCAHAPHYQAIADTLRAEGFTAITINPGRTVPECYAFADGIVTFEGPRSAYAAWRPLAWMQRYPASKFWHLVFDVPQPALGEVLSSSKSRWAGVVFITDDSMSSAGSNPWDDYPQAGYLDALRSGLVSSSRGAAPVAAGGPVAGRLPAPASGGGTAAGPMPGGRGLTPPGGSSGSAFIGFVGPMIPLPPPPTEVVEPMSTYRSSGFVTDDHGVMGRLPERTAADVPARSEAASARGASGAAEPEAQADDAITGERSARYLARRQAAVLGVQVSTGEVPARLALTGAIRRVHHDITDAVAAAARRVNEGRRPR